MGQKEKIVVREASLGPVIARADHLDGAVEVNKDVFYRLPQRVQEFVLCHEVCHLQHNEWDEARTNALAAQLYLSRAASAADRREREDFLKYLDGNGGYSNFAWATLVPAAVSLGLNIWGRIKNASAGWYSWNRTTQRDNLNVMLTQAFEQSRRSSKQSAADFFWAQMQQYDFKDGDLQKFLSRSENNWVKTEIRAFENDYGFGFEEVTAIDLTAFPLVIVGLGIVIGIAVYYITKKLTK